MRDLLIEKLYEITKKPYQKFFEKGTPWNLTPSQLIQYNQDSLGFHLGCFLLKYNFEMEPKLEDHDIIHVLTDTGVSVQEEIGMQFYLFGNGKRSLYMCLVILTGACFYPTRLKYFAKQYKRGKNAHTFHDLNYLKMLKIPVVVLKETFNIK